tara:strand:- start:706 stop:1170 length:465 start_codon:yes stop_codon:yes gene_type:complete
MPRIKRKRVGDVGIRLKPVETNLLENYNEFSNRRKKTRKKKKKKIKKSKRTVTKSIEIHDKVDPLYKIMEESKDKPKEEIDIKELSDKIDKTKVEKVESEEPEEPEEKEEPVFKKIQVHEGKADITKKDPNIKSLSITVSTEPDKKKKGQRIEF